jgi:hypothetical protein
MHATKRGCVDLVKALVSREGINLGWQTNTGHTALELSKFYRQKEIHDLITKAGVSAVVNSE